MASVFCLLLFFFYFYDLINFKIVFLSLYSDNLIMLEFRDVWEKDCCVYSRCVCSYERREKQGICVKVLSHHFSLYIFLLIWEDKKCGPGRENFFLGFLSSPFSFSNQIVENNIFHHIFLILVSILLVFTPTKHSLKLERK